APVPQASRRTNSAARAPPNCPDRAPIGAGWRGWRRMRKPPPPAGRCTRSGVGIPHASRNHLTAGPDASHHIVSSSGVTRSIGNDRAEREHAPLTSRPVASTVELATGGCSSSSWWWSPLPNAGLAPAPRPRPPCSSRRSGLPPTPAIALHQLQVVSELVLGPRHRISLVHRGDGTAGRVWTRPGRQVGLPARPTDRSVDGDSVGAR